MTQLQTATLKLNTGYEMPLVGFGTYKLTGAEGEAAIKNAIEVGYRHIDTAYLYGNEVNLGNAIKTCIENGTVKREQLFIATKLWSTYMRPDLVRDHFLQSLKSLQLKYIDLYLIHWPMARQEGGINIPLNENGEPIFSDVDYWDTWAEMQKLVDEGLVRSIGVSNFNSQQVQKLLDNSYKHPVSVLQIESSPYFTNDKLIRWAQDKGIVVTAFSSFNNPGRASIQAEDRILFEEPKVLEVAKSHSRSPGQVVLRWAIQRGISVIPKSSTKSRMIENIQVFDFELTKEEMSVLESFEQIRLIAVARNSHHKHYPFNIEF